MNNRHLANWATVPLSEIGVLISGQSPPQSAVNQDGQGTPYVTGPEQWTGEEVVVDKWTTAAATVVPERSIFIMLRGSVVGVVFPGISSAIGRGIAAFVPYEPLNRQYLIAVLRDMCKVFVEQARGHVPGISRADLLSLQIPIPPLAEQQRIVSTLRSVDDLLEETLNQIVVSRTNARRLRDSALADAFLGVSTAAWRQAEAANTATPEEVTFEPTSTNDASVTKGRYALALGNPASSPVATWRWTRLAEVAELRTGHTPSRSEPDYWGGDIPWISIKDARDHYGQTISDTSEHVTEAGIANSSAEVLPVGTVCLSRTAAIGYVVVTGKPMATSQDFINWTCGPIIDSVWLRALFVAERDALPNFGRGSIHKTIYLDDANRLYVLLPPIAEQKRIANMVLESLDGLSRIEEEMDHAEASARAARDAARSGALTGRLHTSAVEDESACDLLRRLDRDVEVLKVPSSTPAADQEGPTTERLVSTVRDSTGGLRPEVLFAAAGYRKDAVDLFYSHLKLTFKANQVRYDATTDLVVPYEA
jgi:type I restriction enzyme S subunit